MTICPHCVATAIGSVSIIALSASSIVYTLKGRAKLALDALRMSERHTIEG